MAVFILFRSVAAAEEKWVQLSSPHFEILTDAGAGPAREVLRRFEQIRGVLRTILQFHGSSAQPVRVFVFRSENEFAEYKEPGCKAMAGFYRADQDRDFIAMQNTGADIYRVVFHEYVHLVLHHSGIQPPLWFNEGTAELFSTVETAGSQIRLGGVSRPHVVTLLRDQMIDLPTLMRVDQKSEFYNERDKAGMFYAESWALVHMLNLSSAYAPGLQRFVELMCTGTSQAEALAQVYRKSTDEVFRDLQHYIHAERFLTRVFKAEPLGAIGTIQPKHLTSSESGLALADLLINLGQSQQAEWKLKRLAADHPNIAVIEEGLGDTALAQRRQADALAHYQRSIDLGSKSARVYFEKAALVRENHGDLKQAMHDLQRAIEIDPSYSQARELLARMEFTSKSVDEPATNRFETHRAADVPKSWQNRKGDRRIEGRLVQVDCLGKPARLHILAKSRQIALHVDDPSKVVLTNATGTSVEFACGTIQPRDVSIEYIAKPNAELKTAGEITAIQFK